MFTQALCLLVSCLFASSSAIRVDWNTNKGPIVPPTPRTTTPPQLPYREPAPVWEDQSDDIPNPNPYIYMLPPPSRPHPPTNNYATYDGRPWQPPAATTQWSTYVNNNNNNRQPAETTAVAALSAKYVPNVGVQYYALLPGGNRNGLSNDYYLTAGLPADKAHGKYNAKTKKYKAYQKLKYAPSNYLLPVFAFELPATAPYGATFNDASWLNVQQLPAEQPPAQPFRMPTEAAPQQQQPQPQQQLSATNTVGNSGKQAAANAIAHNTKGGSS